MKLPLVVFHDGGQKCRNELMVGEFVKLFIEKWSQKISRAVVNFRISNIKKNLCKILKSLSD